MRTIVKIKKRIFLVAVLFLSTALNAQKYWVGGQGEWSDKNHWSNISGGSAGADIPTITDDVIFDSNSGFKISDTLHIDDFASAKNIDFSSLSKTIILSGASQSSLLVTGKITSISSVNNQFSGCVGMTGTYSDFKYKKFDAGEFYGRQSLIDVYKSKIETEKPLVVSDVDTNITDATCGANGEINIVCNDGVGPFVYDWYPKTQNGDGTATITDLAPGRYTVVIYDLSDGLPFIVSDIQVDGPSPLTISLVPPVDSVSCFGGSDGEITALVFGGVQPYNYTWDDPTAQANMTTLFIPPSSQRLSVPGLPAGTYSLSVTDDVGCTEDGPTWTVEEPTELTSSITDTTHVFCFSDCTGDATVTPAGGTPGYTYDWYDAPNGETINIASDLCQGTYHVEITDANGCLDTSEVTIAQPTQLVASIATYTDVQCFGNDDGTANSGVVGGTTPYTFDWYNVPSTPTAPNVTGLAPGTYNVEITDASGCLDTAEVTIIEPTLLTSSITDTVHILCNGDATGEAEVTPVGGTSGYTYDWYDAGGETTARLTSVIAGTYNVEVTDANGCLDTSVVTITQPSTALTTSITDTTHNLCNGDCDGIAIVTPAGGTTGYTFDWYDAPGGITDSTINNLCAGTYNVRVTDGNGCTDVSTVEITEPDELTGTTSLTMIDCKSNCNGEIDLTPTGGTTAYTFDWYDVPGTPTSEDVTGLCDGTYNVEITDANGCLDTVTATITEPDTLVASIVSSTNILCNGETTGDAAVTQTGGTGPYGYSWYDAVPDPGTSTINNLAAGTYNVEVSDANGCLDTTQITLTQPATALSSSIVDTVHILCKNVCSGEAEVLAAGGTPGYNYDWYDVPGTPTVVRATSLCDGTYHVEITDGNGCLDTSEVTITEPTLALSIAVNDSSNTTCNSVCDGWGLATYTGGTAGYTLDWYTAGNQTTDTAFNLCAGTHYVEITDANGCLDTADVVIEEPDPLVITINSATLPTCYGDCDGEMSITPSGGTAPYLFDWFDAAGTPTTSNAPGNCAGSYNVRVEDAQGCFDTALVILSEPDSLEHTIDAENDLLCKNECNGSAVMTPIGGTTPYTVTWYDVPGTPTGTTVSDLCAGTWNFELQDANGCLDSGTVNLTEPALELTSSITDTTHNVCFGECNGDATVTAAGGTGLLTYDWYDSPDGDTDVQAENLCAGTYNVEITDANGCLDTSSVTITEPADLVITTAVENSSCGNLDTSKASVAVSGGIAPYTYDWYDAGNVTNDTVTGLAAGTYHCEVTDANGCVDTAEVTITTPTPVIASIRADTIHIDCFGNCNGRAVANRTGGTPGYTYSWYDVPGTPTIRTANNLCGGIYHVEVTDNLGCKDTAEVEIREPSLLVSSADSTEASCYGVCDGRAWTDYSGGTSPYNVDWLNAGNQTTDTIDNVCAGVYQVEITDANGCLDTAEVEVTAPIVVTSSITDTTHVLCFNDCDGEAIVTPVGGVTPYSYDWFNAPSPDTDSTGNNLCVGTYNVEVTDANGCKDTSEVTITSTSPEIVGSMDSILTSCVGTSDGSAIANISGGIPNYTLDWYDAGNQTTDTATGLIAGTYNIEVTDALGCIDTFSVSVTEPDTLRAIISDTTHILCFADSTGEAIVTPTGGTPGYTYDWYDTPAGGTDSTASNLPIGTFHVEVTDANGCLDTGIVTLTQPTIISLGSDSIQATCTGICTGAAIVVPSGGVGPYSFDWYDAGGQTNDTASALCAGLYNVEVTDANGCLDTLEVEVTEPVTIIASAVDSMATTCPGGSDGWAAVSGAGGTLPYTYWWNDALNQTNDTAYNVVAGTYKAAVTDFNGCSDTVEIAVNQPDPISPNDSLINVSCNGLCDGYISLDVTGGTKGAGYTHSWNTASTDTFLINLCAGTYVDTITDGIGCIDTLTFVITQPDSLKALFSDTTDVVCSYSANGQAIVTPTGGTPIYTYDWYDVPGGDNDSVASGILPGTYHVEVIDANGCIDTGEIVISSPAPIVMTTDSVESTCSGICDGIAIVSTAGGTAPYNYDWFDNGNINNDSVYNLCADTFSVAVVDANGCRDTAEAIVTQPVTIVASLVETTETTCPDGSDGWAVIAGTGGTAPYSYWWSDPLNQTNDTAVGLTAGTYRAAVTDANGCSDTIDVVIGQPAAWAHVKDSTPTSCYEVCDGIITITPVGGTGPYTHNWSVGSASPTIIGLCDAIYTDTISDSRGCLDTVSVTITQPDSLQALPLLIQNVACYGDSTGMARGTGLGGTSPYSYEWGDPVIASTDTLFTAPADTFRLIITDANGCKDTNGIRITQPNQLVSSIVDTIHANCVCNAEATVGVTGGVYPYTYLWNDLNVTTDSIADSLCTGSYFVEVMDANGCIDTSEVTIRDTSLFNITFTDTTHITCNGLCNGGAVVTPNLGIAPFTFAWTDPALTTDSTVTNLCAGTVNVTVTDSIGCIRFASITINQPDSLIGTPQFISPLCNGDTNGVAWVDVAGGTAPYFHSWDTTSVNDTVYNIGIGFYTDTITDANGCLDTVTVNVTEPAILQANLDSMNISCFGSADGTVLSVPSGGITPYSFEWNDPSTSTNDTVNNLDVGIYTAIVTDFNGCKDTDSVAITQPPLLTSSITDTSHVACFCTGIAIVTPVGGTAPYTYLWNNTQTDSTATGLCAGSYSVVVSDANGCTDTSFVTIRDTSGFVTDIVDSIMNGCYGLCNGSALARAENGVQPYSFTWNDPALTTDSLVNNLCEGTYSVTISDAVGCTHIESVIITAPDSLGIALLDTNVTCNGGCDGSIKVAMTGGTSPYSYRWLIPTLDTTVYLDSLCPGQYIVEVLDNNGCFATDTATITEPAELIAFISPFNHVSCFGENDASLTALPTGGTGPYSYSWDSGEFTQTISGKGPNTYTVTVTDSLNCTDDTSLTIIEPIVLASSITDTTHILCGGTLTGSATVTPTGGTTPYSYDWFDAPGSQTDSVAINLPAGTYKVEVMDANGCSDTSEVTITEPTPFSAAITNSTTTSCTVCDGTAAVTPAGGVMPYTYNWYNVPTTPTDSSVIGLCASSYNVEVIDGNGCIDTVGVTITGPGGLTGTIVDSSLTSCNGLSDGWAVASGVAGTAPYTYIWDDAASTANDTVTGLSAGIYNVSITDANGCIAAASVIISEPDSLLASIFDTTSTGCASPCTGDATAVVTGGTAPYSYSWDDWSSQTGITASNLCAAQYTVTVTDANGCQDTAVAFVAGPNNLTVAVDSSVNVDCNGDCDGVAAITASGGVGGFSYIWNDPSTSTDTIVTGLCAGNYNAQVTDGNGCLAFANITISEPDPLVVVMADSSDVVCNGVADGWALVSYTGGTAPYTVSWNDGALQSTDTAKNLVSGTYTVTVTDANGCSGSAKVTLEQPSAITASTSNVQHVLCTGFCIGQATLTVSGGTVGGGYSYLWEDGQTSPAATGLCQGFQTYTVTDGAGCQLVDSVEILDQNNFTATLTGTTVSCNGDCDGTVLATPAGGTAPYGHSWDNGSTSDNLSGLCPGVYIDTISDANGCFLVDSFEVLEPTVFTTNIIDSTNASCFGICDGMAVAQGNGGTAPYQFTWYNAPGSQVNDTAFNLCAATYFVLGEDANGCSMEDTVSLSQPAKINVSLDASTNLSCYGDCSGTATVSANGGVGALSITWNDGSTLTNRTGLCAEQFTVYATDASLCVDSLVFSLTEPDSLVAIITDTSHIVCATVCDGDATVGETGGTGPFTYDWYDAGGSTSNKITGQCAGTYHVEVTDGNGCIDTAEVIINDINVLNGTLATTHISCTGLCDGKLVAQPVGGVAPYTYQWNDFTILDSIEDLCQGNYFVTITDFEGCQVSVAGSIVEPVPLTSSIIDSANLDCYQVCDGYATVSPSGGTGPYTYQWNDPASQTGITATGLCAQTYKVVVTDSRGCLDSSYAYLEEPTQLVSVITENQANCTNLADGSVDITVSGGTPNYTFNWSGPNGFSSGIEDITGLAIGQYEVTILDDNGCSLLDTAIITEVNVVNANAGNDTTICQADSILLQGTGGVLYTWSDGGATANHWVSPTSTTEYILTVFNNGCSDTDSVTVNVNALPSVTAIASDYLILDGTSTQLIATGAGTGGYYDWEPPFGLTDPTISNPMATINSPVTYTVTGTDVNGCTDTALVTITVANTIVFPDGITPNGDGLNETWVIQLIKEFPDAVVQIYNRWGQKVFESVGYTEEWDGTMNGKKLPVGTYYYVIDLGPELEKFAGPITLMR